VGSARPHQVLICLTLRTLLKRTVLLPFFFAFLLWCQSNISRASDIPAGRLVSYQGDVAILPEGKTSWEGAQNGRDLFAGDSVKTGQDSRASILCVDETQLKLNGNTVVVLKSSAPSARMGIAVPAAERAAGVSLYEVPAGEVWLRNKNEKTRFEVQTPAVTAAIRGTEFNLKVDRAGATSLVLLEGKLTLANAQGQIELDPGEEGYARVGQAPVKRVIVQPADAVQWSLYYPGIFSCRDIPLDARIKGGTTSPLLRQAAGSYDLGDLDVSQRDADEALEKDPENAQALTILGWISLQRQDPRKAAEYFEHTWKAAGRETDLTDLTICGLALAIYRAGDAAGAYKLMAEEIRKGPPSSLMLVMSGYFSMLVGKIDQAKALLSDGRINRMDSVIARSLLAQIYLVQNDKDRALKEAAEAHEINKNSPIANMTSALVEISYFDLPQAMEFLEESIEADPRFIEAYVYLARLCLGDDHLDKAWEIIGKALELSKTDSEVLSLAGFIRLGYRDYDRACKLFEEAVKDNPSFGEPHIGLANIAFRNRNFSLGVTEMLTATLLEPRVSLYQCSLGKALYQTKAFNKALEVYDYAKTLDPHDPTPYLYKGIALTDLYRPGEAIQEINKSIELNDNTAVFRSRLMLDRDLAVRNANLATSYNQLGLNSWAYSKAVTAVKNDPLNASARLLLSSAYLSTNQRVGAAGSELLQYILLAPANENTFAQSPAGDFIDYTQMFEMPYVRYEAEAGVGTYADHHALYQDYSLNFLAGLPGLAVDAYGEYMCDPGFRKINDGEESISGLIDGKFDPTIKDSFYVNYSNGHDNLGDTSNGNDFTYRNDPLLRSSSYDNTAQGGYVHRFSPSAVFISYFHWDDFKFQNWDAAYPYQPNYYPVPILYKSYLNETWDTNNLQLQQQLKLGDHTLIAGFHYINGAINIYSSYSYWFEYENHLNYLDTFRYFSNPPDRDTAGYIHDYWRVSPELLVELGLSGDVTRSSRYDWGYGGSVASTTFNPLVGLNYEVDKSNTLRFAYQSYVVEGPYLNSSNISPSEVAGFPSQLNAESGSKVQELGFFWESQWNPLTYTVLELSAYRVDDPEFSQYLYLDDDRTEHFEGSLTLNRLLTQSIGLAASLGGKYVHLNEPDLGLWGDFYEIDGSIGLSWVHPSGWFASIADAVLDQNLNDLNGSLARKQEALGDPFNVVNIAIGKHFADKRGFASLGVSNLFNQHFFFEVEPQTYWNYYPDRRIIFQVGLFF
jgi:tetratricopeptide (TPR) repeat protein